MISMLSSFISKVSPCRLRRRCSARSRGCFAWLFDWWRWLTGRRCIEPSPCPLRTAGGSLYECALQYSRFQLARFLCLEFGLVQRCLNYWFTLVRAPSTVKDRWLAWTWQCLTRTLWNSGCSSPSCCTPTQPAPATSSLCPFWLT
jgi:hypothetical protein